MDSKKLWKIHNWVGLYAGIVIAFLSLTGALAVFIPEIDWLLSKEYHIEPDPSSSPDWDLVQQNLQEKYADFNLNGIIIPDSPDRPYNYLFFQDSEEGFRAQTAFVNPFNGEILGARERNNTISNFLRQIHVRLFDGLYGRQIVGLAGIALVISSITGLMIYGNFMKKQVFARIRSGKGLRIAAADWHKLVGISALLFNLIIAITGAWLGLQPKLMDWFNMEVPNKFVAERMVMDREEDAFFPVEINGAIAKSKEAIQGFVPKRIRLSSDGSGTVTVLGDVAGGVFERAANKVVMDKVSLKPLYIYDARNQSFGDKLYYVQEALHFGQFGGMWLKILYAVLGLTTGFLSITGFLIYLKRKEAKAANSYKTEKVVFAYCMGGLLFFVLTGLFTVTVGYSITSNVITFSVYIFLACYVTYQFIKTIKKRTVKKQKDAHAKVIQ
ncbi:MAG: PepSY-associated TM helix domain-containing protein [Anditalea sp.]